MYQRFRQSLICLWWLVLSPELISANDQSRPKIVAHVIGGQKWHKNLSIYFTKGQSKSRIHSVSYEDSITIFIQFYFHSNFLSIIVNQSTISARTHSCIVAKDSFNLQNIQIKFLSNIFENLQPQKNKHLLRLNVEMHSFCFLKAFHLFIVKIIYEN